MASSSSSPRTSPPTVSVPLDVPTRPPLEGPNSDSSISTVASTSSSYSLPLSDSASFVSTSSAGVGGEHPYSKLVIIKRSASPFDQDPFDTMHGASDLGHDSSTSPTINLGSHSVYAPRSASTYPPTTTSTSSRSGQMRDSNFKVGPGSSRNLLPFSQASTRSFLHPHSLAPAGTEKSAKVVDAGAREVLAENPRSTGPVRSGEAKNSEEGIDSIGSLGEGREESFTSGALAPITVLSPLSLSPGLTAPLRQASLPSYNRPVLQSDTYPTSTISPITSASSAISPLVNPNKTPVRRQSLPALITTTPSPLSSNHSRSPESSSTISSLPQITPQTDSTTTFRSSLISASPAESHPPLINQARPASTPTFTSSSGSGSNSSSCGSGSGSGMSGGGTGGGIGGSGASYWSGTNSGGMYGSGGGSSRPWVIDSDASSVYSGGSWGSGGAGMSPGMIGNFKDDASLGSSQDGVKLGGDAEVLKVDGDGGIAFLDPRPEPVGAKLTIFREDLDQVVIKVVLPGFTLDNITVAMRRGHKIHIVADSWGETGGHFEKLISLGSDASSSAPRAEFNGTDLYVYVQRRTSSRTNPPTSLSTASSPNLSSGIMSPSLAHSPPNSTASPTLADAPVATRSTATSSATSQPPSNKNSKSLTGPEGAKAAAKAAKEEAARRAKEVAKTLPKLSAIIGGVRGNRERSLPLLPAAETGLGLGLGVGLGEREESIDSNIGVKQSDYRSTSLPVSSKSDHSSTSIPATPPTIPYPSPPTSLTSPSSSKDLTPTASSRPKLPGSNRTLRPSGSGTFLEAAMGVANNIITGGSSSGNKSGEENSKESEGTGELALTPKLEKTGFFSSRS